MLGIYQKPPERFCSEQRWFPLDWVVCYTLGYNKCVLWNTSDRWRHLSHLFAHHTELWAPWYQHSPNNHNIYKNDTIGIKFILEKNHRAFYSPRKRNCTFVYHPHFIVFSWPNLNYFKSIKIPSDNTAFPLKRRLMGLLFRLIPGLPLY